MAWNILGFVCAWLLLVSAQQSPQQPPQQEQCLVPQVDLETGKVEKDAVVCQHGRCVHDASFFQLVYRSNGDKEAVRFTGADRCVCTPGFWGPKCEFMCPLQHCLEKHVYPQRHVGYAEKCGQMFYDMSAFNISYMLTPPGICNCPKPFLGEACQFVLNTPTGAPTGLSVDHIVQQELMRNGGVLLPSSALSPTIQAYQVSQQSICGRFGTFHKPNASCQCTSKWLPTTTFMADASSESMMGRKLLQWHVPSDATEAQAHAWTYGQIPICAHPEARFKQAFTGLTPGLGLEYPGMADAGLLENPEALLQFFRSEYARYGNEVYEGTTVTECIAILSSSLRDDHDDVQQCRRLASFIRQARRSQMYIPLLGSSPDASVRGLPPSELRSRGLSSVALALIIILAIVLFIAILILICCFCRPSGCPCGPTVQDEGNRYKRIDSSETSWLDM